MYVWFWLDKWRGAAAAGAVWVAACSISINLASKCSSVVAQCEQSGGLSQLECQAKHEEAARCKDEMCAGKTRQKGQINGNERWAEPPGRLSL